MDQLTVDSIVAGVDYTTIIAGMAGIAVVIAGVKVAKAGARALLGFIRA